MSHIKYKSSLVTKFLTLLLGAALLIGTPSLHASRIYGSTWSNLYPGSSSDDNAGCALCHTSFDGGGLNAYGLDMTRSVAGTINLRILDIETMDSDDDPTNSSNLAEIEANAQPAWTGFAPSGVLGDLDPVVNQPPTADANGPYSGIVAVDVTFDGRGSSDPDGSIDSYAWNFGDGSTGSGPMPAHKYATDGTFTVTLTVTDNDGASDSATTTAEIGLANVPPIADANGPYNGTVNIPLSFDGTGSTDSDGSIVTYEWDFGDGASGSGPTPSHTYSEAGDYTVGLTVTDDFGDTGSATSTATIGLGNLPPVADANGPYSGTTGIAISFDGSGSTDPDGSVAIYDWDFGDGTVLFNAGPTPIHIYTVADTYNITLTVTDNDGVSDSDGTTATIADANQPPVADPNGPYSALEGETVDFDGSGSSDPDGSIVSYTWDFGDGTTGSGVFLSHVYTAAGSYDVSLTVMDDAGASDTATTIVSVGGVNQFPVADANGPYSGIVGMDITFDGTGSSDPDGNITSYSWDFGDGSTESGPMPAHAYATDGTFTVTLTVTDNDGASDTATSTAEIGLANVPPIADANGPYNGTVDIPVDFDATGSTDADGSIVSYAWDFGDGSTGSGATPSHIYTETGEFTVTLTVTDDGGANGEATSTATIGLANMPPIADANGPYSGTTGVEISFDGTGSSDPDGSIEIYDWDFGDGTLMTDAGPTPTHAYAVAGTYNVTLTVFDNDGVSDSNGTTATIVDAAQPPVAADDSYSTQVDTTLIVNAPGVLANDTDANGDPLTAVLITGPANGTLSLSADGSFSYTPDIGFSGTDKFSYLANDGSDNSAPAMVSIIVTTVKNQPPVADPDGPYDGIEGSTVKFDGSGSSDPDGTIVSYAWDFGDGSSGEGVSPSHTFTSAGTYVISLTVTDDDGDTDSAATTAVITEKDDDNDADEDKHKHRHWWNHWHHHWRHYWHQFRHHWHNKWHNHKNHHRYRNRYKHDDYDND